MRWVVGAVGLVALVSLAAAQAPFLIDFQGRLFTAAGSPVTASQSMTFRIYNQFTGGSPLWTETQTVSVNNGYFDVILGGSTSLGVVPFNQALFLEVFTGTLTLTPRLNFTKAAFAASLSGVVVVNASTNNVGIGTTAPSTKLHVVGGARITGLSSCNTIDTDASGNLVCGTDEVNGTGGATTTLHAAKMSSTAGQTVGLTITSLNFTAVDFDNGGLANTTTDNFTIQRSGKYLITAGMWVGGVADGHDVVLFINRNGVSVKAGFDSSAQPGGSDFVYSSVTDVLELTAGDVIGLSVQATDSYVLATGSTTKPRMSVIELGRAGGIPTPSSFFAHRNGVSQATAAGQLILTTERFDTNSDFYPSGSPDALTGCTSCFRPSQPGKYLLTAAADAISGFATSDGVVVNIRKNGASHARGSFVDRSAFSTTSVATVVVDANGTDYFDVSIASASGNSLTFAGDADVTYFSGSRIDGADSWWQNNGSSIYYNSGSVGIGTSSPASALHINGSGELTLGATGPGLYSTLLREDAGTNFFWQGKMAMNDHVRIYGVGTTDNGELRIETGDNGDEPIVFRQTATERMRIHSNGFVGISTTSPSYPLDVQRNTAGFLTSIRVSGDNGASDGGSGVILSENNTLKWHIFQRKQGSPTNSLAFSTSENDYAGSKMLITPAGNVGIGTTSPGVKLTVVGSINATGTGAGNVPHQCVRRSFTGASGGGASVSCLAGEKVVSCAFGCGGAHLHSRAIFPSADLTSCTNVCADSSGVGSTDPTDVVYAVCCKT